MTKKQLYLIIGATAIVGITLTGLVLFLRMRATADLQANPSSKAPSSSVGAATSSGVVVDSYDELVKKEQATLDARPVDSDEDGLSDKEEAVLGANPKESDTEGDGYTDYEEVEILKSDPLKADVNLRGRPSLEASTATSQPVKPQDSDSDGLTDEEEQKLGADPHNPDTDGDGLSDFNEVMVYGTNPLKADTDGDGFTDKEEITKGYDPLGSGMCKNSNCTP